MSFEYNIKILAGLDRYYMMKAWCWRELKPSSIWICQHIYEEYDPPIGKSRICRRNFGSFWFNDITDAMAFKIVWT